MTARQLLVGVLLIGCTPTFLVAAEPPEKVSIDELIRHLGHPDYHTREAATRELWGRGEIARPALLDTLSTGSPEAAVRASKILSKFEWGITPDTSADALEQIRIYRSGTTAERAGALVKLAEGGPGNHFVLQRLLQKPVFDPPGVSPGTTRRRTFEPFGRAVVARVPLLLFDGRVAEAESLLALTLCGPIEDHHRDYVLFMAAQGRAADAVTLIKSHRTTAASEGVDLAMAYALVASGRRTEAKSLLKDLASADSAFDHKYDTFLADSGDWAALTARPAHQANSTEGLAAFRLRLGGKSASADELLAAIAAADAPSEKGFAIDRGAVGLFLNGRTDAGLDRLKATQSAPHVAADIHIARLEFATALDLIRSGLAEDHGAIDDGLWPESRRTLFTLYKLKKARLLAELGERDAAAQLLAGLEDVADRTETGVQAEMVRTAIRCGFPNTAARLLGVIQARRDETGSSRWSNIYDPFEPLFDVDAGAARFWWKVVRDADRTAHPGEQMQTVHDLLTGGLKPAEVRKWFRSADEYAERSEVADNYTPVSSDPLGHATALATAYRANGNVAKAVAVLERLADGQWEGKSPSDVNARGWVFGLDESFRVWIDLGDWLGELGRHADAAKRLEQGWRRHPNNPILLYLSGRALAKAGDETEGQRRIALSHVIPLGNPRLRGRFLEELVNRGEKTDMRIEIARIGECVWGVDDGSIGNVWNQVGRAAVILHDFATARDANRKGMHFVLKTCGIVYVDGYAYANVPALTRGLEACQLVREGKTREAVAAAETALTIVPTHTETVHRVVDQLDRHGDQSEADKLFTAVWERYQTAIKANTKSASLKQRAAWLALGCGRHPTLALEYAEAAAAANPDHHQTRETLAEAHFRNGHREKAVELMTTLVATDYRNHHYKRQLERYKTAPFDSPLPLLGE